MKKRYVFLVLLVSIFSILVLKNEAYGADLDEITNYIVTVDPRTNDGSLDITYEITWRVLDSTSQGPLTWVEIGTPNSYYDTPTALTKNIKSITEYNGSYVRIDFTKAYKAGEELTFKYSIHQPYMHKVFLDKCTYKFTPAWFTDARVDNMTIRWNNDEVIKSNTKMTEDNYLIWNKQNMGKGEKLTAEVKYKKSTFGYLSKYSKNMNNQYNDNYSSSGDIVETKYIFTVLFIIVVLCIIVNALSGGNYYRHRGFYDGPRHRHHGGYGPPPPSYNRGCVSSCACVQSSCASSCACACAGSGRAGCSKKDFYGTNIMSDKLKRISK